MPWSLQDSTVQTVLGRIPARELGVCDAHTHLIRLGGPLVDGSRDFLLDSVEKGATELELFRQSGGAAVVEMTPCGPGRDVRLLADISRRSGVHVIAAAGFVDWALYPGTRPWLEAASVEEVAALIAAEISDGCDANNYCGPLIRRAEHRAGVVKVATGYQVITPLQEKLLRAAAAVHRSTGAPISAHTEHGTCVLEFVELLTSQGVPPDAIIVAHTFHNPDPVYQRDLAQTGIFLIQDGPSRVKYQPESNTISQIKKFLEDGFGSQLLFAGDHSRRSYWKSYGGGPGFDYLLRSFAPRLRQAGVPEAAINAMFVENAARAFRLHDVQNPA